MRADRRHGGRGHRRTRCAGRQPRLHDDGTAYAAAKAGLIALVKALGRELAPEGIIVNAVAPGVTDTPQLQVDADAAGIDLAAMHARYAEAIPLGRIGRP